VQRIYAHESIYDELRKRLVAAAKKLKTGDPKKKDTFLGPMVDEAAAKRLEGWIADARKHGAKVLCGGNRKGNMLDATVVEGVKPELDLSRREAFGPVVLLAPYSRFDDALAAVNDSDFGLQAGIFTQNLDHAMRAWAELEQGGVIVNDVPSFRVDSMPYGGVKSSGVGREGVRYAIDDMSDLRLMVMREAGWASAAG